MPLVLASASPRRADLLRAAGFTFEICVADVDERVREGETPAGYVRRLAEEKTARVLALLAGTSTDLGHAVILGADTAVIVGGAILGKPSDDDDAAAMLRRLSGRRHEVLTGVSLRTVDGERGLVEASGVYMAGLSEADIAWHVASGDGRGKAGAYAIQGLASRFISRIEGSYANVVGLPVAAVWTLLRELASRGESGLF